jgi:DNA-binding NtrC family response regulator
MITGNVTSRERVVIVDRDLDFGLKLADCLASSGYHAVLGRSLDAMLEDLGEMQPGAIVLSSDPCDGEWGSDGDATLQEVRTLCPEAPVITLTKPGQAASAGMRLQKRTLEGRSKPMAPNRVEELLRTKLGIPCARVL